MENWFVSPERAVGYALGLLVPGFVWGAIAAQVPMLRSARPISHFAHNRAVAVPILAAWTVLAYLLSRSYFAVTHAPVEEGLRLGLVFAGAALAFDLVVVAWIVGEGWRHFKQPVLWVAYALLVGIPWSVGGAYGATGK